MKILLAILGGMFLGWLIFFAAFMFGSGVKVLKRSEGDGYSVSVLERRIFPFGVQHQIAVGGGSFDSRGFYGHFREIGPIEEPEKVQVEWTQEGVTIIETTGHRTHIPKESYAGGR